MRLFLAINPPAEVRRGIWNATAMIREAAPSVSWVAESRLHITLKFFGDQPESALEPLVDTMRAIGQLHSPPLARLGGVGAFPNFRRPRVVWIGVDPDPRLELLHHDVELACERLGYPVEGRPFRPHFTLGRITETGSAEQLRALRTAARKVRFSDEFPAVAIDMMHTKSGPDGTAYDTLATAPMRGV